MQQVQVQDQAMAKGVQAVDSAAVEIHRLNQQLDGQVQTLMSAWRGESQHAFATVYTRWEAEQRKLHTALQDMHDALDQTQTKNRAQEQERAGQFSHIAGLL